MKKAEGKKDDKNEQDSKDGKDQEDKCFLVPPPKTKKFVAPEKLSTHDVVTVFILQR